MKKETVKKIRAFVAPLVESGAIPEDYVVHPSGLIVPCGQDTGFSGDLYGGVCPVAVLDEDTFADALHYTAETHMPELLLAAFDDRAGEHSPNDVRIPVAHLRDTLALMLDCIDWSVVEDEWDDDMITALMTEGGTGTIMDYVKEDGFWLVVKPSGNLITSLIDMNRCVHDKWLVRPVEKIKAA